MPGNILLVTATQAEADIIRRIARPDKSSDGYFFRDTSVRILITGVGSVSTSWMLAKWYLSNPSPDLAINIGIAGSYRQEIQIGDVVMPVSDCFSDAGIETENGFLTLSEAGLEDPDRFPFKKDKIIAANRFVQQAINKIKPVSSITVNTASGSEATIERLRKKFNPDIETMEGAAFFYICSMADIPFMALRAVSNMVESRNINNWNIPLALENLTGILEEILLTLDL